VGVLQQEQGRRSFTVRNLCGVVFLHLPGCLVIDQPQLEDVAFLGHAG